MGFGVHNLPNDNLDLMDDNFADLDHFGDFAGRGGHLPLNSPDTLGVGGVFGEEVISRQK